jgi:hypothetical protein
MEQAVSQLMNMHLRAARVNVEYGNCAQAGLVVEKRGATWAYEEDIAHTPDRCIMLMTEDDDIGSVICALPFEILALR